MDIVKIGLIGIAGTLIAVPFKSGKGAYATYISMAVCICIFFYVLSKLEVITRSFGQISEYVELSANYIKILLKMVGITYIAEFSSNICKDAGYQAIATQIEMFGKLAILAVSMPVLIQLLETITEFLG